MVPYIVFVTIWCIAFLMINCSLICAEGEGGLRVCLAGVDLTHDGKVWLESQLHPGDLVWFRLYERQGETLHCSVIRPKVQVS